MEGQADRSTTGVLVVTADREFAAACERFLPEHGEFTVRSATTASEAMDVLETDASVECIVSDHDLPETDGVAFLETVRAQSPTLPFVLFTGDEAVASQAISAGVSEYLVKEVHGDQWGRLASLVDAVVAHYRSRVDVVDVGERARTLLDAAHDMIGVVRDGRFEYLNATGLDYCAIDDRAAVGKPVGEVFSTDDDTVVEQIAAVQAGERRLDHSEMRLCPSDGVNRPVEVTSTRITWGEEPAVVLVVRDVSDREARLRELSLRERAMNEAPVGITIADASRPDNPIVYANDAFERLTGYDVDYVEGRNCRFLQGEGTDPEPVAAMREAIDAEEPVTVELRNYRKDGTEFWNRVTIAPVRDDGTVTHYVGFQEDVTERVESERMLRRFRRAVEAAGNAIYITDADGTITYVNPAFERVTGYASDEAVGRTPRTLRSDETSEERPADPWETVSDGNVVEREIRDRRKSGATYHARQTIAPITTEDGEVEAYVVIQTDVTEQKEREERLRQFEQAVEGASELIGAVDEDYHYLFANEAYRDFHGIEAEEVRETTLREGVGTETYETIEPYVERAFDGETVQYRMTRTRPDRANGTFAINYQPLRDDDETVWAVIATMRDLSEQVERERQLAALDRLLRHTLHNDLNVVLGHARTIEEEAADEIAEHATPIIEAAERLLTQADKEREIVELLTGPFSLEVVDLAERMRDIVANVETDHPEATIRLKAPQEASVRTIPEVELAIREVVENAVIHSDREHPRVDLTVRHEDETVRIRVEDDGPGIPTEERAVIAENEDIDSLTHSSGMGLWLVKRIVSQADGTVHFEEREPRGTTVVLTLPAR